MKAGAWVDTDTKLVVQGLTGREGTFHALAAKAYGTQVVAGVTPGKGGLKNYAAKASVDIALYDLLGKYLNVPLHKYLGIHRRDDIYTSYTIGISDSGKAKQKIEKATEFKFLKVKLGSESDREIIMRVRELSDKPLFIDVNQGWRDKYFALDMISWLAEQHVLLIEQPLPKENL